MKLNYKSILCDAYCIDEKQSVVALVRKPHGKNAEHVFILVESLNPFDLLTFNRYDFVINNKQDGKGEVIVKTIAVNESNALDELKYNILDDDEIIGKTWSISREDALSLHQNILRSKEKSETEPDYYNLLGDVASLPQSGDSLRKVSPQSAETTSETIETTVKKTSGHVPPTLKAALSPSGHNCYTWARYMLLSIHNQLIDNELPRNLFDFFGVVPSLHIRSNGSEKKSSIPACIIV